VLVVEDDYAVRSYFCSSVKRAGLDVAPAATGTEALDALAQAHYDVVLLDLKLPDVDGLEVLRKITANYPGTAVIVITGTESVKTSVQAMKLGAWNYHVKPIEDFSRIISEIREAAAEASLKASPRPAVSQRPRRSPFLVGETPAIKRVLDLAARAASVDSPVLICGESGTGKELVARIIHENCARKRGRFLAVNCSAVMDSLLESTLFGYERGAFTGAYRRTKGYFEAADGGTLFLDEVGDTSLRLQAKLLRAIEDGSFQRVGGTETVYSDVRIIAATNKDLEQEVRAGRFREDLYYRINVLNINIPPLRERKEDIRLLAGYFLQKHAARMRRHVVGFTEECLRRLEAYAWPGNVRELENVVERALAFQDGSERLGVETLPPALRNGATPAACGAGEVPKYAEAKEKFEREYLLKLLERTRGNVSAASRLAGIARQNLYAKLRKHGIAPRRRG